MSDINVTIPKGEHTSKELSRLLLRITPVFWFYFRRRKLSAYIRINTPPYDTKGDKDLRKDWSKAFGFNLQLWAGSNENSIMAAFRSDDETNRWEVTPYANVGGSNLAGLKDKEVALRVMNGEWFIFEVTPKDRNEFTAELFQRFPDTDKWESKGSVTHKYPVSTWLGALIGPWHGGKDDDGNDLGGEAPVDVNIDIQWDFVRK